MVEFWKDSGDTRLGVIDERDLFDFLNQIGEVYTVETPQENYSVITAEEIEREFSKGNSKQIEWEMVFQEEENYIKMDFMTSYYNEADSEEPVTHPEHGNLVPAEKVSD